MVPEEGGHMGSAESPLQNDKDRVYLLQWMKFPREAARSVSVFSGLDQGVLYVFYIFAGF